MENVENTGVTMDQQDDEPTMTAARSRQRVRKPTLQGPSFEPEGNTYNFTTSTVAPTVHGFLCAQTSYINSLQTFAEVNAATQHTVDHLILT